MQISAHPIAPVPMPAPAPGGSSAPQPGEDSPFAKMLSARQEPAQAESATPDHAASEADAAESKNDAANRAAKNARQAKAGAARGPAREPAQRAEPTPQAVKPVADADADSAVDAAESKDGTNAAETPIASMDPALAQWLASLNRPTAPVANIPAVDPRAAGDAMALEGGALKPALPAAAAKAAPEAPDLRGAKTAAARTTGLEAAALAEPKAQEAALQAASEEHHVTQNKLERPGVIDTPAPIALPAVGALSRAESPPAAVVLSLPTPVVSPDFKGALGVQVSVLARDGIQHAELHLNPAEMGPISVQIALDGTAAQVDFGADSATTRQIIEAGLPELASALRDAGFTLSGGGVSQHSRGGQAQADADGRPRTTSQQAAGASDAAPARAVNLRLPLGAVDLYA